MEGGRTRTSLAAAWASLNTRRAELVCVCLLVLMGANLLSVVWRKGLTADEFYHVPAGYYHLARGEFRVNTEHPPLAKMLAAVPLLFAGVEAPAPQFAPGALPAERTDETSSLFWRANTARFESIAFWSRLPAIVITLGLGWLIFIYARRLFGRRAALLAVVLYALEPTMLAHGRVVQTDVPAALAYLLFFYALDTYWLRPTFGRALLLGGAVGLALATKFSLVIVVPVFALAALWMFVAAPRRRLRRSRVAVQAGAAALVALLFVNAVYYFQSPPPLAGDLAYVARQSPSAAGLLVSCARVLSRVVPSPFLLGLYQVAVHNRNGHLASVMGRYGYEGWALYFPVAFALKTTLPFLLLSLAALAWAARGLWRGRGRRLLLLLGPFALYGLFAVSSRINIGVRHIIPLFPFLFILGGALLERVFSSGHTKRVLTAFALLCWIVCEAARAYPHYIPYMNQLAWRRPHWYYLTDSNVEWGDDVKELARYLRARGETRVTAALLDGGSFDEKSIPYVRTLDHYGVEQLNLISAEEADLAPPETRYVAVGASYLNGAFLLAVPVPQRLKVIEYRKRTPEAVIGNSIYLYRVKE
ncbi:MAG: glycosyltransferase family 39 protein [Acidobacteria bacterium]|nr:glycosyltransferase family 39 protein [Acidobacteriota bacterium]